MTINDMLEIIPTLSLSERKQLLHALVDSFSDASDKSKRSILEFAGIGAELYDGTDAQDYIKQMRDEWDQQA
jgi:hypothetical protein